MKWNKNQSISKIRLQINWLKQKIIIFPFLHCCYAFILGLLTKWMDEAVGGFLVKMVKICARDLGRGAWFGSSESLHVFVVLVVFVWNNLIGLKLRVQLTYICCCCCFCEAGNNPTLYISILFYRIYSYGAIIVMKIWSIIKHHFVQFLS